MFSKYDKTTKLNSALLGNLSNLQMNPSSIRIRILKVKKPERIVHENVKVACILNLPSVFRRCSGSRGQR